MAGNQGRGIPDPQPTLVEFGKPPHKDSILASADIIKEINRGEITLEQDDAAISKIKIKESIG